MKFLLGFCSKCFEPVINTFQTSITTSIRKFEDIFAMQTDFIMNLGYRTLKKVISNQPVWNILQACIHGCKLFASTELREHTTVLNFWLII